MFFGVIKDSSGAVLPFAKVTLQNLATSGKRELQSDDKGLFYFTLLPPGTYELTIEAPGFKLYRDSKVQVLVAQVARTDVEMQIGSTSESVQVVASVSALNTENVAQGTVEWTPFLRQPVNP